MKKKPIAIFDIDGTIFRSSLAIELFRMLVEEGVFSKKSWETIERKQLKWLDREGGYDKYEGEIVKWYPKEIKGKTRKQVVAVGRKVIKEYKKRVYRYTSSLIQDLKRTHFLIGISGSPLEVVEEYNKFLKFDKIYGSEFGVDEKGVYTGKILHIPPLYKKEIIVRYIQGHKLSLRGSIGVGDTESDIGFLELVDRPIAFNPNFQLGEYAKKKNWTVVVERKDLIYEFKPKKVKYLHVE